MFSSSLSRSSLSARDKQSSSVHYERLKCVICGKGQHNNETAKSTMEESERATTFVNTTSHLMDEVFTRVADLQDVFDVFTADTRYYNVYLESYLRRYGRSLNDSSPLTTVSNKWATFQMETERIRSILDQGNGLTLSEIRDIMNSKQDELEISNKEIKHSLMEQLQDSIQICLSKKKNESLLVFSTKPSAQVIVQKVESTDIIKRAALSLRHTIPKQSFDLDDKFCDNNDLERSGKKQKFPINL